MHCTWSSSGDDVLRADKGPGGDDDATGVDRARFRYLVSTYSPPDSAAMRFNIALSTPIEMQ